MGVFAPEPRECFWITISDPFELNVTYLIQVMAYSSQYPD